MESESNIADTPMSITAERFSPNVREALDRTVQAPNFGIANSAGRPSKIAAKLREVWVSAEGGSGQGKEAYKRLIVRQTGARKYSDFSGDMFSVAFLGAGAAPGVGGGVALDDEERRSWMRVTRVASTAIAIIWIEKPIVLKLTSP